MSIRGTVDLVHLTAETIEIIDYKTDLDRHAASEYRIQLSVYWHVLSAAYPDREITAGIFYTAADERVTVDPLSRAELGGRVRDHADWG